MRRLTTAAVAAVLLASAISLLRAQDEAAGESAPGAVAFAEPGRVAAWEYRLVPLTAGEEKGVEAVEKRLNAVGAEGFSFAAVIGDNPSNPVLLFQRPKR